MRCPDCVLDRRQIAASLTQNRIAEIQVIKQHVRSPVEAMIGNAIANQDFIRAQARFDSPY